SGTGVNVTYKSFGDLSSVASVHLQLDSNPDVASSNLNGSRSFSNVSQGQHTLNAWLERSDGTTIAGTNVSVPFKTTLNNPPSISIAGNSTVGISQPAPLNATVTDDGLPNGTLTFAWTQISGPGTVSFAN